jgi:hypothetical protein
MEALKGKVSKINLLGDKAMRRKGKEIAEG